MTFNFKSEQERCSVRNMGGKVRGKKEGQSE